MTPDDFILALQALGWQALPATRPLWPDIGQPGTDPSPISTPTPTFTVASGAGSPPESPHSADLRQPPGALPAALHAFCAAHGGLQNPAQTVWFYGLADHAGQSDAAFSWDFAQRLSLDAAVSEADTWAVRAFWQAHTPFAASVAGDYAYLALRRDGAVVVGQGPEFEESAEWLADSLPAFFTAFVAHLTGQARDARLLDFG